MQSLRLALRAVASTDASGVTTYAVNAGRYELTDATGATSTGGLHGSIVVGLGDSVEPRAHVLLTPGARRARRGLLA